MRNKKILITGGAGFIGSHLADKLIGGGNDVSVIDNLSTGAKSNIEHLLGNGRFSFIEDSILNKKTMDTLAAGCDVIYHLAAAVGVRLIVEDPVHTIETNIFGSEIVLQAANKYKRPLFIASTSEVYGKNDNVPFREEDDTVMGCTQMPRWSYACSKAVDEFLALAYYKQYGQPVVIGRFFNTIGPRQSGQYGMVVPRFVKAAIANEPIHIYGDGKQSRCFSNVADVIEAAIKLMNEPKAIGGVFNIGSTEEITINELADLIIKLAGSKSVKEYVSYEQAYGANFDDMSRRLPSADKLERTVGFKPTTKLAQTLETIIDAFKAIRK